MMNRYAREDELSKRIDVACDEVAEAIRAYLTDMDADAIYVVGTIILGLQDERVVKLMRLIHAADMQE
jgi:hypothetical protein